MKLPRDLTGAELVKLLSQTGYEVIRQRGSHIRLRLVTNTGEHFITVPNHVPLKVGTLNGILGEVSEHQKISREELIRGLFT